MPIIATTHEPVTLFPFVHLTYHQGYDHFDVAAQIGPADSTSLCSDSCSNPILIPGGNISEQSVSEQEIVSSHKPMFMWR